MIIKIKGECDTCDFLKSVEIRCDEFPSGPPVELLSVFKSVKMHLIKKHQIKGYFNPSNYGTISMIIPRGKSN